MLVFEEIRENVLSLMTVILCNSRIDFFAQNVDSYLNVEVLPKLKYRYAYSCTLQLLRGRYYQDTLQNCDELAKGTYVAGRHFAFLTRKSEEQTAGIVSNRLNTISEYIFSRSQIPTDKLDECASIVAQISAHNIQIGSKLIGQLLDTTRVENTAAAYFMGLKALRIIIDPASGFQQFAASAKTDPNFYSAIELLPSQLLSGLSTIYSLMESQIGVLATAPSGKVINIGKKMEANNRYSRTAIDERSQALGVSLEQLELSAENRSSMATLSRTTVSEPNLSTSRFNSLQDLSKKESEIDILLKNTLNEWFSSIGLNARPLQKYVYVNDLIDKALIKKNKSLKLKNDQLISMCLFEELMLIIRLVPSPEFIGGNHFIGSFLCHYMESVASNVHEVLFGIFVDFPSLRLGYFQAYVE
jgi:hypothetical protein